MKTRNWKFGFKAGLQGLYRIYQRRDSFHGVYSITAVDATGAGDSFDGAFISGLLEGKTIEDILKMASAAGALNTAAFGPMEGKINPQTIQAMIDAKA